MKEPHHVTERISSSRVRVPSIAFVRAQDLLEQSLRGRSDALEAMQKAHVAFDGHGRTLGIAADVAARLQMPPQNLVGRRFIHRMIGPDRVYFARALVALRTRGAFEPLVVTFRQKQEPHLVARLGLFVTLPAPDKSVVGICEVRFEE